MKLLDSYIKNRDGPRNHCSWCYKLAAIPIISYCSIINQGKFLQYLSQNQTAMKVPPQSQVNKTRRAGGTGKKSGLIEERGEKSKISKENQNQNVCAACLFEISVSTQEHCSTECAHHYHEKCLQQWLKQKNTCCLCRQKIKKYTSSTKGEVSVPDRPERTSLFDLLIPFDTLDHPSDLSQIIIFNGGLENSWGVLMRNNLPSRQTHFVFSLSMEEDQYQYQSPINIIHEVREDLPAIEPVNQFSRGASADDQVPRSRNSRQIKRKPRISRISKKPQRRLTRGLASRTRSKAAIQRPKKTQEKSKKIKTQTTNQRT